MLAIIKKAEGTKMFNKSNSKSNFHACYLDVTINNEYHKGIMIVFITITMRVFKLFK